MSAGAHARCGAIMWALAALASVTLAGCKPYRIEYRTRPSYYSQLSDDPLPDRVELEDGTVIVWTPRGSEADGDPRGGSGMEFQMREELEDGSVELHAARPEHVVANTLNCLRLAEYDLLWDQLLSERTKLVYAEAGLGREAFAAFCEENRNEMAKTLNRMLRGMAVHEVVVENKGDGIIECRMWPQIAQQFKYKRVSIVSEGLGLKLLRVH